MSQTASRRSSQDTQDRTLSDLIESYRHIQSDPSISRERKREASERMTDVWSKLARLQDEDGFVTHLSDHIAREHHRRSESGSEGRTRRKPLCRCGMSRHVCEVKKGEVPSHIRTQSLSYLSSPDPRANAREYVQSHSGDVVVREAMDEYRELRANIYSELNAILAYLRGNDEEPELEPQDVPDGADSAATSSEDESLVGQTAAASAPRLDADGGVDMDAVDGDEDGRED